MSSQKGNGEREVWLWGLAVRKRDPLRGRLNDGICAQHKDPKFQYPEEGLAPLSEVLLGKNACFLGVMETTAGAVKAGSIGHSVETSVEWRKAGDTCVAIFCC